MNCYESQMRTRVTYPLEVLARGEPVGRLHSVPVSNLSATMLDLATARILGLREVFALTGVKLDIDLKVTSVSVNEVEKADEARSWSPSTSDVDWRYLSARLGIVTERGGNGRDARLREIVASHLSDPVLIPVWFLPR
jgi:hypothetical protein